MPTKKAGRTRAPRTVLKDLPAPSGLPKLTKTDMAEIRALGKRPPSAPNRSTKWRIVEVWALPSGPDDIFRIVKTAVR
jgi:hypothetical protein